MPNLIKVESKLLLCRIFYTSTNGIPANENAYKLTIFFQVISKEEYEKWLPIQIAAEISMDEKERNLFHAANMIETNLELLGATGIEDKLQEGVAETISSLRAAGITVWVLTGDKQV